MAGRRARSHSQYDTYTNCGWRYKLKYVDGEVEDPAVWLAGGNAFHSATEIFDKLAWAVGACEDLREHTLNSWGAALENEFDRLREIEPDESKWRAAGRKTRALPNGQDAAWWRENGPIMVHAYIDWRIANADLYDVATLPDGNPAVEFGGESEAGSVPVKFFPDVLILDKHTGANIVVDKKTGTRMPASGIQLGEYALWIWQKYGIAVWWGAFYDARRAQLEIPRPLGRWTEQLVAEMYSNLDRGIEQEIFLPRLSRDCKGCGVRSKCKFQPQRVRQQ